MIDAAHYISRITTILPDPDARIPWLVTAGAAKLILGKMTGLGPDYRIFNDVAIHKTARIDSHAILKGPAIISAQCFVAAHSYLRGGVFLDENVSIGPGCEVKASFIFSHSALGHFNFVGDSILGSHVNLEAGAVVANYYNERLDKNIRVTVNGNTLPTGVPKFGALVGDRCRIGANAVLSPGTILPSATVVGRLELVEQNPL